jgi:hypothetical protein
MFYKVKYKNWSGTTCLVKVEVKETQVWDERLYYATNLEQLGCGFDEATPMLAIKALIADHGYFISAEPI